MTYLLFCGACLLVVLAAAYTAPLYPSDEEM
jgi:hypothetical protein